MSRARNENLEAVTFNGVRYARKPGHRYFFANRWDKVAKKYVYESLHKAIWRFHKGDIPAGHDVHHKDDDWNNNTIENLDCISHGDHMRKHWVKWKATGAAFIAKMCAWTTTDDGREILKENARKTWDATPTREFVCAQCGNNFSRKSLVRHVRFCSRRCGQQFRTAGLASVRSDG